MRERGTRERERETESNTLRDGSKLTDNGLHKIKWVGKHQGKRYSDRFHI